MLRSHSFYRAPQVQICTYTAWGDMETTGVRFLGLKGGSSIVRLEVTMDGWRLKAPPTCMSHIVAPPASRGGCTVPAFPVPGSSGRLPPNLGTLGPASSTFQAAQPVPFSHLPKAAGFQRIKRALRSRCQISGTHREPSRQGRQPSPPLPSSSQQASLEGVYWAGGIPASQPGP